MKKRRCDKCKLKSAGGTLPLPLTDDDERVVDVHAAEAVGGLADVGPGVLGLHLFNAQGVL